MTRVAREVLEHLLEGNRRFAAGCPRVDGASSRERRRALAEVQEPSAVVLSCSDARVPTEMVFDQALGELFVVRVAGNVVAAPQLGSVEFAVRLFGARLVVVLGHTRCGAVAATLAELQRPGAPLSPHVAAIVDLVRPSVAGLLADPRRPADGDALVGEAVRANVRAGLRHLRDGSTFIAELIEGGELLLAGAEYDLDSGLVSLLRDTPESPLAP